MIEIDKEPEENIIFAVDNMIGRLSDNLLEKLFQNEVEAEELRHYAKELKNFSNFLMDDTMILQKLQNSESMKAYYEGRLREAEQTYFKLMEELEGCHEKNKELQQPKNVYKGESEKKRRRSHGGILKDITNLQFGQKSSTQDASLQKFSQKNPKMRSDSIENYVSAEDFKKLQERLKASDKRRNQLISDRKYLDDVKGGLDDKLNIYRKKIQNLTVENDKVKQKLDEEANMNNSFFDRTHDVEKNLKRKEETLLEMEMKFNELQKFNKILYEEIQNKNEELQTARNELLDKNLELNKICDDKIKEIKRKNNVFANQHDRSMDMSGSVYSDQKAVENSVRVVITPMQKNVLILKNDQACLKAKFEKLSGKKLFDCPTPVRERTTKKKNTSGLQGTAFAGTAILPSSKKGIKHTAKIDDGGRSHTSKESINPFGNFGLDGEQGEITEGKINISFLTNEEQDLISRTDHFETDKEISFEEVLLNTIPRGKEKIIEEEDEDKFPDVTEFKPQETKDKRKKKESFKPNAKLMSSSDSVQIAKSTYGNEIQPLIKELLKENSTNSRRKNNSKLINDKVPETKQKAQEGCCTNCGLCNIF